MSCRVRFAPSPTGFLHIGNARTALFNWLYAKSVGGTFILRIDDTDQKRSTSEAVDMAIRSLKWMGLEWDEGPGKDKGNGPYFQSERLDIYKEHIDKLLESGKAYYCFCSSEELDMKSKGQKTLSQLQIYDGKCSSVSLAEAKERIANGEKARVRFFNNENKIVSFDDVVRGVVKKESKEIGDFVIFKEDGFPTYNFATVIDEALMGITHVIRGEDHISNTAKQLLLYQAYNFDIPIFAHTSMILGSDKEKLSKRHGASTVMDFEAEGYLPEGIRNFLALLGWSHPEAVEALTDEELIKAFTLNRFSKSPAVFDMNKFNHINTWHIRNIDIDDAVSRFLPYLIKGGYIPENPDEEKLAWSKKLVMIVREHCSVLSDICAHVDVFFKDDFVLTDEMKKVIETEESKKLLIYIKEQIENSDDITEAVMKAIIKNAQKETGLKGPLLYHPIRYALTGNISGTELASVAELLGKDKLVNRISRFIE